MICRFLLGAATLNLVVFTTTPAAIAEMPSTNTWPQWRGVHRDAKVSDSVWPDSLKTDRLSRTWRVELGPSYSGPIVTSDRVFVTETAGRKFEVVRALDRSNGTELWKRQWEGSMSVPFFAASNGSWIRATPAYDGKRLYVAGMRDVLVCLDGDSGDEIWRLDFVRQAGTPVPNFGFVSSPLVVGDHLYVQAGAGFAKVDKDSGKIVWRSLADGGGMFGSAFSSPTLAEINGTPQMLVQTRTKLAGVDPESGQVLWQEEVPAFRGMNILTPTAINNSVFTSSYGGKSFLFTTERSGDAWQVKQAWSNKLQGYMSTPVVIDNHIYLHLKNRRFTCIDAQSGEIRWTSKPFGKYWSLVANGSQILALDQQGELLLINANPEKFDLVDRRKIGNDTWAHLAVCGDELFVRELDAMTAFRWQ